MDDIRDRILADAVGRWALRPDDILFVSGSRAAGFGNRSSDLDVFLIFSRDLGRLFPGSHAVLIDEALVDYQAYSLDAMADLARTINALFPGDETALRTVNREDLDVYYRTAIGEALWNPRAFVALQQRFGVATLAMVFHAWAAQRGAKALLRAVTSLRDQNARSALLDARSAVEWALDAFLASHGEPFPSRKWRFEKLERACGRASDVYRRAWDLKSWGRRDAGEYVSAAQKFCRELGTAERPPSAEGSPRPRPNASVRLFSIDGRSYLVQRGAVAYELDAAAARLWRGLAGETSLADLARDLAASSGEPATVTTDEATRFVAMLEARGLLAPED